MVEMELLSCSVWDHYDIRGGRVYRIQLSIWDELLYNVILIDRLKDLSCFSLKNLATGTQGCCPHGWKGSYPHITQN